MSQSTFSLLRLLVCLLPPLSAPVVASLALEAPSTSTPLYQSSLMPAPVLLREAKGDLLLSSALPLRLSCAGDARLLPQLDALLTAWERRTGLAFSRTADGTRIFAENGSPASLDLSCEAAGASLPALGEDESYVLDVSEGRASLSAHTGTGLLRGLATLQQLPASRGDSWFLPACHIEDRPRFQWRGLMIDSARHFFPVSMIKRQLDGMALVKLNVLHWHLSDDHAFRVESKRYPLLHTCGYDQFHYTHADIREVVAYAAARGIRVVPEFDVPGHTRSWLAAYPSLSSEPGPFLAGRSPGIFREVIDPSKEEVYVFLKELFTELAPLFPDPYFHIGGDEVDGRQWNDSPAVQAFIRKNALVDNEGLQAYFNTRLSTILAGLNKKVMGWNEILHPTLPKDSVIHVWIGQEALLKALHEGYSVVLSKGFYIDLSYPSWRHYSVDPMPEAGLLNASEQSRLLGAEATMWSEFVSPDSVDSRIWPRTAAIAERYWSQSSLRDTADMYRRLEIVSRRLEEAGLTHERNRDALVRQLAGDAASASDRSVLDAYLDLLEPVKRYQRGTYFPEFTSYSPLTSMVDAARPESIRVWHLTHAIDQLVRSSRGRDPARLQQLRSDLLVLQHTVSAFQSAAPRYTPKARESLVLSERLQQLLASGIQLVDTLSANSAQSEAARQQALEALNAAAKPHLALEFPLVPALRALLLCTGSLRDTASTAQWQAAVDAVLLPPLDP